MSDCLTLLNIVLRRTGQVEAATVTAAQTPVVQALDFLNETYFEMLRLLKVNRLLKMATLETTAGTANYTLPGNVEPDRLIRDSLLETGSGQMLKEVDYTYALDLGPDAEGLPTAFYRQGAEIRLYPVPDDVYTIQFHYFASPVALTADEDETDLPESWERLLILGAQARLEKFLGEPAESTYLLYREGIAQLKVQSSLKPHYRMRGYYRGSC